MVYLFRRDDNLVGKNSKSFFFFIFAVPKIIKYKKKWSEMSKIETKKWLLVFFFLLN